VRTIVKGKNIEVPDRVRRYAEKRFHRLERFLDDRTDAIVELSNEQHRSADDAHIAEVTLVIDGQTLRGHANGPSYQAAVDTVVDKIERRAVAHREKPRVRARPVEEKAILRRIADGTAEPERDRRIVKVKRFAIEPMFEEDAIARMEELGHAFFVFVNAETERVAVLYRREDGDYGLIEPVVGGGYTPGRENGRAGSEASPAGRSRATRR
jgi:putative sigma-54 modulation protein